MGVPSSSSTYHRAVEHVRRVRGRRGGGATRQAQSGAPSSRRSPWRIGLATWIAAAAFWAVCFAAPLYSGLHTRAALARPPSVAASDVPDRDPVAALLRNQLLHGLTVTLAARVPARGGTA